MGRMGMGGWLKQAASPVNRRLLQPAPFSQNRAANELRARLVQTHQVRVRT